MTHFQEAPVYRNAIRFLIFILPVLISGFGCTRPKSDANQVVLALGAEPATLDPRTATDATGTRIAGLLYSALVRTGQDLRPVGEAAESWTEKGLVYEFKLREGLSFSNGDPVLSSDIQNSFEFALDPAKSPYASAFSVVKSVKVLPEGTTPAKSVRIELKDSSATFLNDLFTIKFVSEKKSDLGLPLGSGPFELVSFNANDIVIRARTRHAYATPKIKEAIFKIVRDDQTRASKMLKGELDIAQAEFPPGKIKSFENNDNLVIHESPGLSMTYVLINHQNPLLGKKEIREAMSLAIDRESIVDHQLEDHAEVATALVTPSNPFYVDLPKPKFDLAAAKEKMKDAALKKLTLKTSNNPGAIDNGRLIVADLKKAGLDVQHESYEWGKFYSDVVEGRFDLAVMRWTGTIDPDLYRRAFHTSEVPPAGRNRGRYSSPKLDKLLERGSREMNFEKRRSIYAEIEKIALEDLPILPLWYDNDIAIVHKRIRGYVQPRDGSFWPLTEVSKE